jgi:hypothetical protein
MAMIMAGVPPEAREDPFSPPDEPVMVECIHCGSEYLSDRIVWRVGPDGKGFWCCPIRGCDGMGFGFDIWPLDARVDDESDEDDACEDDDDDDT